MFQRMCHCGGKFYVYAEEVSYQIISSSLKEQRGIKYNCGV